MNYKKIAAIAFILMLTLIPISLCIADGCTDADTGYKYISKAEGGGFTDMSDGTVTLTFRSPGEYTVRIIEGTDGHDYVNQKVTVEADKLVRGFSFRIGSQGDHNLTIYVNDYKEANISVGVAHSIWKDPGVYIVIVIAVIAIIIIAFMKYRSVNDAKKDFPKEKVFTKMAEEKKKKGSQ